VVTCEIKLIQNFQCFISDVTTSLFIVTVLQYCLVLQYCFVE